MRTLYVFGPHFGLPDASPFCMKAMILLKMAGLAYETGQCDPRKAPKKKGPFLVDDGDTIPDSTFIRCHIEKKYGFNFEDGLSEEQRGISWAVEKLCEDNVYWAMLSERWLVEENFEAGPRHFFDPVPSVMRPLVVSMVRSQVKRDLWGQGLGRHTREELVRIGNRGIEAVSQVLGDKAFLMGDKPCGADASAFPTVAGVLCDRFQSEMLEHAKTKANLLAYRDRCMELWFPDFRRGSLQAAA